MFAQNSPYPKEPTIDVGLIDATERVEIALHGTYLTSDGNEQPACTLAITCKKGRLFVDVVDATLEASSTGLEKLELQPSIFSDCQFSLDVVIGIDFHWEQTERESFRGGLLLLPKGENQVTVINRVPLEEYITSVICSEMNADSHPDSVKSHAVISRSWLLSQLDARKQLSKTAPASASSQPVEKADEIVRWTDRQSHQNYDVCADDHCQRYQGIGRTDSPVVAAVIAETRGQVLAFEGQACDARFSKSCGGVVEEFRAAWADIEVPYLVALVDSEGACADRNSNAKGEHPIHQKESLPNLTDEVTMRQFIEKPPEAFCNCTDDDILNRVLNDYDQTTVDFFRWHITLTAEEASELIRQRIGLNVGRLLALEPVERGKSGRLIRLRFVGEKRSVIVGKELEIRKALSKTHLYSSAFVIDTSGPKERPDTFMLSGAGWGHGVGLCQIGAAVMACRGFSYRDILSHYYPNATVDTFYA